MTLKSQLLVEGCRSVGGGKVRHFPLTLTVAVNAGLALSATGNKCRYIDTVAKTLPAVNLHR